MNCENIFCIYQSNGHCLLSSIELDNEGKCKECIYVTINDARLRAYKIKQRNELEQSL